MSSFIQMAVSCKIAAAASATFAAAASAAAGDAAVAAARSAVHVGATPASTEADSAAARPAGAVRTAADESQAPEPRREQTWRLHILKVPQQRQQQTQQHQQLRHYSFSKWTKMEEQDYKGTFIAVATEGTRISSRTIG